jgi:hypothetical protein
MTLSSIRRAGHHASAPGKREKFHALALGGGPIERHAYASVVSQRHPEAVGVVPPRATAVPSETAETEPSQRDRHLQTIAKYGRLAWQKQSGYTTRARAEAAMGRWKQVIGDGLRADGPASGG